MEIELKKTSISLPESIMNYLDRQAAKWMTHRSGAITRIVMEWQEAQAEQLRLTGLDPKEETPQAQLRIEA